MKLTAEDMKNLGQEFRSITEANSVALQRIKWDVVKFLIGELNERPAAWLLEPGDKNIQISFTVVKR